MVTTTDITGAARSQAQEVAGTTAEATSQVTTQAKQQAADVADVAKEQAAQVVGDAVDQGRALLEQTGRQLEEQATEQSRRLAHNIRDLAGQLGSMAAAGEQGSAATHVVRRAADHGERVASYLDGKRPGELVADLQQLGRRRPGAFLLGAAIAGLAAGRLATAARKGGDTSPGSEPTPPLAGPTGAIPTFPPAGGRPSHEIGDSGAPGAATVEPPTGVTPAGGW